MILKLAGMLTVAGGTNKIIEYFGPGTEALSCTAKATITNMGAELGATTSVFPFDKRMADYLRATGRAEIARLAEDVRAQLSADHEVLNDPAKYYDEVVEIDLSSPRAAGGRAAHTRSRARRVAPGRRRAGKWLPGEDSAPRSSAVAPTSSYEDIGRAAHIARQAKARGLKARVPFMVTPGSEQVRATIERDGLLADLEAIGATVLANACGPCIGQWERTDIAKGEKNSILTSYNRNFPARNDGNPSYPCVYRQPGGGHGLCARRAAGHRPDSSGRAARRRRAFKLVPPVGEELPAKGLRCR